MADLPTRVTFSDEVLFQELEGETVLLDLRSGRYFILDDVGTRMWQVLHEHGDPAAARAVLVDEYDVDAETLEGDLAALISRLSDAGLVGVE
jgi:hypothetical protein